VGRAAELAAVLARLRGGDRLVCLVATGGSGKTRLATEVALVLAGELPGGAWWFDLADARTADDVCAAIAAQLGAPLGRTDPVAQVAAALAARGPALAVLDNLEQCVDAARAVVPRLLDLSPDTQLLCTSRTPLKVRGERVVLVDALPIDDAVALFRDRAPGPVPDAHHDELRALCAELGGLPLAIELAAARGRTMSVPTMRQRLGLRLLAGGGAELPDRHRSLEASIRWSWDLLSEPARHALCQLSVFVGGCSLAAAEAVLDERALGPDGWALDRLQELSEASLLRVEPESDRFGLLSVVQSFAAARSSPADRDAAEARHAAFFAQLGAPGAVQRLVARAIAPDAENLVAAARSAIRRGDAAAVPPLLAAALAVLDRVGAPGTVDELVRDALGVPGLAARDRGALAASAARGALVTGRPEEAARHLATAEAALAGATEPLLVGQLAWTRAMAHRFEGRHDAAASTFDAALAALEGIGDPYLLARVISSRGGLAAELGQVEEAAGWFERSLRLRRAGGDRLGEAMDRANLANLALARRQPAEALAHQQAALAGYRETGDARGEAQITGDLGLSLQGLGQAADAERHYRTALSLHRRAGNRRFEGIVSSNLGSLLLEAGRLDEAEQVVRGALALHRQVHNRRSEGIAGEVLAKVLAAAGRRDEAVAAARAALECHVAARNPRWERTTRELLATWGAEGP
jgi:predicted ATPase/predicted negative regulator of RcsB-dependent stress response